MRLRESINSYFTRARMQRSSEPNQINSDHLSVEVSAGTIPKSALGEIQSIFEGLKDNSAFHCKQL